MSTRIDDLPGPLPQDIVGDLSHISNSLGVSRPQSPNVMDAQADRPITNNVFVEPECERDSQIEYKTRPDSNIRLNIKKRVHFEDQSSERLGILGFLRSQLTEENVMLLLILILAARSEPDRYLKMVPYLGTYIETDFLLQIVKGIVLLLIFLLARHYVLPNFIV